MTTPGVISLRTYGYPNPLRVLPQCHILTAEGWREAGQLRAMDWLTFPIPQGDTPLDDLRAMLPAAPKSEAKAVSRLTGEKLPVTRQTLKAHLDAGLTYQQIAGLYGRKNRTAAYGWALLYGLTRPVDNVLTGDPIADPDFWRVVGYWLAEGDITSGRSGGKRNVIRWTFGHSEQDFADDVAAVLARYGLTVNVHGSERLRSISVRCSSAQLAAFLDACGHGAANKYLPERFVTLPEHLAREMVRGYWLGDGTLTLPGDTMNDGWCRIASISVGLLMGFYRLLPRLGVAASIMKTGARTCPLHELRFPMCDAPWLGHPGRSIRQHSVRIDGDRLMVKIKRITVEEYDGPTCDIQERTGEFAIGNILLAV